MLSARRRNVKQTQDLLIQSQECYFYLFIGDFQSQIATRNRMLYPDCIPVYQPLPAFSAPLSLGEEFLVMLECAAKELTVLLSRLLKLLNFDYAALFDLASRS